LGNAEGRIVMPELRLGPTYHRAFIHRSRNPR
jgi:hypothetical protein